MDEAAAIRLKDGLLKHLRSTLGSRDFLEVITPTARRADDLTHKRVPVESPHARFLRSMIGPALRVNLQYHPRIYEIGTCFRSDEPDASHSPEFQMLDLYAAGESLAYLKNLAVDLIAPAWSGSLERVSVAERLRSATGLDLATESSDALQEPLAGILAMSPSTPISDLFDSFLQREVEANLPSGGVIVEDYPLGGTEPCARRTPGTSGVLNRFEIFVHRVEVVHGYEDETDLEAFESRAATVGLYDDEQARAINAVRAGHVPSESVGLGIGIERLCMAARPGSAIDLFRQSSAF